MTDLALTPPAALQALREGRLVGARRLDLRGCGLSAVPDELVTLADTLEHLDLSDNALDHLPQALAGFPRLQVLFCSNNRFRELPPVLGRCPALDILGFKANQIEHVPPQALAPSLRWLILTDNRVDELPERIGHCAPLQKLMLAGNRLRRLPAALARCERLALIRLAANDFPTAADALPDAVLALPQLTWLAHGGNPFNAAQEAQALRTAAHGGPGRDIAWAELKVGERLGEGASGVIHAAHWCAPGAALSPGPADGRGLPVAVKLFKGAVTSDGLPASEMAATLAAGEHPHLVAPLGRLVGHPAGAQGLVLQRVPAGHRALAAPPSFASCTRDVYAPALRLGVDRAVALARGAASALDHLHARGLQHGDLYAHNLLVGDDGPGLLSDFGAASFLPEGDAARRAALVRLDRRALAVLVDELAALSEAPAVVRAAVGVGA